MRTYIKKLQAKEEGKRKQIFVFSMIGSMSIVALVWFYSLGMRFGNPEMKVQANEDIKPFKIFKESVSNTVKNMGASVGKAPSVKDTSTPVDQKLEKQIDLIPVENTNQ